MDKNAAEILAKVKKLMALGSSPSEAEASSALEKARLLLARYGLSIADVDTETSAVGQEILLEKKRLRKWEADLIQVITSCTFTHAIHVQRGALGQVLIVGRELNIQAAIDLFGYLHLAVLKLGRTFSDQAACLESFKRGVVYRIGERLMDMNNDPENDGGPWTGSENTSNKTDSRSEELTDRQLMIQMHKNTEKENLDYISLKFGKTSSKKSGSTVHALSFMLGQSAGDTVSLKRQIQ